MKKLVSLLLALALLLTAAVCVAEGSEAAAIGSPDNPVVVRYLCKDVDPSDPDVQTYVQQISEKMAALGQYVTIEVMEAPAGTYADAVPLAMSTGELEADLVYFQGGDQTCANLGLLEDLTDYIANSTYVQDIMEDYNKERLANYPYLSGDAVHPDHARGPSGGHRHGRDAQKRSLGGKLPHRAQETGG